MATSDAIEPVDAGRGRPSKPDVSAFQRTPSSLSEKVEVVDDEEQARRIADADLHQNHKQVTKSIAVFFLAFPFIPTNDAISRPTVAPSSSGSPSKALESSTVISVQVLFMYFLRLSPVSLAGTM
jgi:hypothetical protein